MPSLEKYDDLRKENEYLRAELLTLQKNDPAADYEKKIKFLSETAIRLLEPLDSHEILKFIADQLYAVTENSIVVVSEYDPATSCIVCREVRSTPEEKKLLDEFLGRRAEGTAYNFPEGVRSRLRPGHLDQLENGLNDLIFGDIPLEVCHHYESALGILSVYGVAFSTENDILGTVAFLSHSPAIKNKLLAESIILKAALALKRVRIESSLKKTLSALVRSEEKYRQLIGLANSIILRFDNNGKLIYINEYGLRLFGYREEELAGKNVLMLVPEKDSSGRTGDSLLKHILSSPEKYIFSENENQHKNGKRLWVRWANRAIRDPNGKVREILSIGYDVTRRKKAEELLKTEHDILMAVIQNIDIGFFVSKPDGTVVLYNDPAQDLHQVKFTKKEVNLYEYIDHFRLEHPDGRHIPGEKWPLMLAVNGEFVSNMQVRLVRLKSKTSKMVSFSMIPVYDNNNLLRLIVFTMQDFTEIYERTEALKESQQRYDSLFNNATQAIQQCKIITNDQGIPVDYEMFRINSTLTRITGITKEQVYGRKATEVFPGIENWGAELISNFGRISLQGGEMNEEFYLPPMGKWFNIYAYSHKKGEFTAFLNDISDRKRSEDELKAAKEKAEESDRLKSVFLANMSHEIRTPMNGILGFADLLKKPHLSEESRNKYIEVINGSGQRMLSIINDLIDISKIEAGQMELKKISTNLSALLDDLIIFFKPESEKYQLEFRLNTDVPPQFNIETDKTKLYQILCNLVKNAIKFTKYLGVIEIGCRINDEKTLFFYVKDNGIGIRPELKESIFERFRQGDAASEHEGVGLGLAISKAYVEMLGGSIGVESEPGKGSVFFFTLPFEGQILPFVPIVSSEAELKKISGKKILVVEDDDMSYLLLSEFLSDTGARLYRATNGVDAIDTVINIPDICLVLMDIKLPVMDGIDATREIKKIKPRLPVIMQSAYAGHEEIERSFNAGSDDYLTKPIDSRQFMKRISELIS